MTRSSGVLLHLSSLPGSHGVGDLGREAFRFIRFLEEAGQTWWQMFPLGPPGMSNSPYQVLSAFAGNPLFIDLESLARDGLLPASDMPRKGHFANDRTDYDQAWRYKKKILRKAFWVFENQRGSFYSAFRSFCYEQRDWLDDYALYCAIKQKHRGAAWYKWDAPLRNRQPKALREAAAQLAIAVRYHQFLQFLFSRQWHRLRKECHRRGVKLLGDIPIFVAHDSADVWANPELFWLDKKGNLTCVSGVPPDYFSRTGQRWGNPLYRWDALKKSGYDWWIRRFRQVFNFFDATRLDHFIGFHNYWCIPASARTAQNGEWVRAPGEDFFAKVERALGRVAIFAEDLGVVTPGVSALREKFRFPGMKVLHFAFSSDASNPFLPHNFGRNSVVYTGTHDNDTTRGWFKLLTAPERQRVLDYVESNGREIHWDLIRLAFGSVAETAIIPLQDLFGLGSAARMNTPGTTTGNWEWRLDHRKLNDRLATRLRKLTETYGRS